jgi:ketosteroid isomerase-like protein
MNDYQQVVQVKNRYGELIDKLVRDPAAGDAEALGDLVTEDAVFDYFKLLGRHEGRAAIVRLFAEVLPSKNQWMSHAFLNPVVEITGDRAEAGFMLLAMSVRKTMPDAAPAITYGRYVDRFVRGRDGRWRQSGLQFFNETRPSAVL